MAYEIYQPRLKKGRKHAQLQVRLSKTSMVFNKYAREKINADVLELAFDPETRSIRVRAADGDDGVALKKTKVHAKGFFKQFGIEEKGKFEAQYKESEKSLFVKL